MVTYEKTYNKSEIISSWKTAYCEITDWLNQLSDETFETSIAQKWSPKEQLEHLYTSAKAVAKAMKLPKEVLTGFGKVEGSPRKITEIVQAYKSKLSVVDLSVNPYAPKKAAEKSRDQLMENWKEVNAFLTQQLEEWEESDFDKYVLPHPLLGKMHVREMLFFTILHTEHHLENMKKIYG